MISPEIRVLLDRADESHEASRTLLDGGFANYAVAQIYYTMFYLAEALLHSKGLQFSSHSAVIAAFGREFAKTQILDPKFHRYLILTQQRRETGHYGREANVTNEEALESFEWLAEFMDAAKNYLDKS